ncbi:MAG: GNAT family N-acetyltransferase [Anaerolineae bacterium]|jgi:GNAT superfamily N-acetyltransferase
MSPAYRIVERVPTLHEYRDLCMAVGWKGVMNFEAAKTALPNSLYGVVAMQGTRAIGMGRVVGDGAIFFYVQDVAVHPEHQGQGVGKRLLEQLVRYLKDVAPEKAFIGLFAARGTNPFYEQFGFRAWPEMTGMFQVVPPRDQYLPNQGSQLGG